MPPSASQVILASVGEDPEEPCTHPVRVPTGPELSKPLDEGALHQVRRVVCISQDSNGMPVQRVPIAPDKEPVRVVFANGWGSQFIILFPELDLVVVTTGGNQENGKHLAIGEILLRELIPGVGRESL